MPLSSVGSGCEVILQAINWGPKIQQKLHDMGLTPGVKILVVSSDSNGAFILNVRGSRIAIGKSMTHQIMVS